MVKYCGDQTLSSESTDECEKTVLGHFESNREKDNGERDNVQKKTFTKWVNKHLAMANLKVDDLFEDLRDGCALIALLEALTEEKIQKDNGFTRFHRIQNVQYCLDFLKKKNIKLVNIRPEDIVEGNGKLTLGLIWTIILNFQVSVIRQRLLQESLEEQHSTSFQQVSESSKSESTSARDALLQWAKKVPSGYPHVHVSNFSSSWRDGFAFNAILHRYRPNSIDWRKISAESVSNRERLENAFVTAEREFGVSRLLDAEDVDTNNPDEKSIITYVSSLYNALPQLPDRGDSNDVINHPEFSTRVSITVGEQTDEKAIEIAENATVTLNISENERILENQESELQIYIVEVRAEIDWLAHAEQRFQKIVKQGKSTEEMLTELKNLKDELDERSIAKEQLVTTALEFVVDVPPNRAATVTQSISEMNQKWTSFYVTLTEKGLKLEEAMLQIEQLSSEISELTVWKNNIQVEHLELVGKLEKFVAEKRKKLDDMIDMTPAQDLKTINDHLCELGSFDSVLREQQPEVDLISKKGAGNAQRTATEWTKLLLDAKGLRSSLDTQKALLEEMKRLEAWKWEEWKERYVDWNDHAKARVTDLFRRIDQLHTGNVPRKVFIDGILESNFPTSRLELEKVADLFDKGDGMINSREFMNALRFDLVDCSQLQINVQPQTDTEKITHEIERQKKTCSCCKAYPIEKISDNHYRFGDTSIKRMVRILRSTVMVRVGGGWMTLDEFLLKHDPCRAKGRINIEMFPELRPADAHDSMRSFTKNRHARDSIIGTPGPITKIREKTERSVPMSGGLGGTAAYSPMNRSFGASSCSTPSRASPGECSSHFRTPSLRGKKGIRCTPRGSSTPSK